MPTIDTDGLYLTAGRLLRSADQVMRHATTLRHACEDAHWQSAGADLFTAHAHAEALRLCAVGAQLEAAAQTLRSHTATALHRQAEVTAAARRLQEASTRLISGVMGTVESVVPNVGALVAGVSRP